MNRDTYDLLRRAFSALEAEPLETLPAWLGELERLRQYLKMKLASGTREQPKEPKADAPLLTMSQVAERLNIKTWRAYELARMGHLPTVKIGKYVRVEPAKLAAYIAENQKAA
jgi:excisionase family DNA binding protein